ncbi:phage tail tube protein [Lacticaseibacillus sp. N501-2]|jgi:hypothetical protein|uniref:phage tail tube protein n=1 Tax=Lacticaseibacillus salsurae TaxID=3367729 RepID=UPI0038B3BEA9
MVKTLAPGDTISSKQATIFATVNGKNINIIECQELTAKIEKNKEQVQAIGSIWTGHKTTSLEGTGSFNRYVVNSTWIQAHQSLLDGGADLYFSINATIEDKTSSVGKQTILISGVNLDDINLLNLSSDDGLITDESDFTFENCKLITPFTGIKA